MSGNDVVAGRLLVTRGPLERMRGLLWRPPLREGEGMYIDRCNAIHTVGMRYAIDVAFLDASGAVVRVVEALAPMRMALCWGARATVELAAGECERLRIRLSRRLRIADGRAP